MTTSASPTLTGRSEQAAPVEQHRGRRRFRGRRPSPWHLALIPISCLLLFPFYLMVVTSLQTQAQTQRFPPLLVPPTPQWSNYPEALSTAPFVRFMINSLVVAIILVISNVVLCSIAGYAFARLRFAGRGVLFALLMATLMVPFQVTMIPEFLIVKWLGTNVWDQLGIDHLGALVLPSLATAFGIFFLRQFFLTVPIELEEAARMDGTSRLGVLFKIVLPLSLPALSTVAAITFLDAWNSFLWPLIVINTESHMTLPLGLTTFQGSHNTHWELLMAGNVFSLVPMLLVFFVAQRYFVRSVAATGLKG